MEKNITVFKDAVVCRYKNKRILLKRVDENAVHIVFQNMMGRDDAQKHSVHTCVTHKGTVAQTDLFLTEEGLEMLSYAYAQFKNNKL